MFKLIKIIVLLQFMFFSNMLWAHNCGWGGSGARKSGSYTITGVEYDGSQMAPIITLSTGEEYTLMKNYGVNWDAGRAMLSVALTAIATGAYVSVCISNNDVGSIKIITDLTPDY